MQFIKFQIFLLLLIIHLNEATNGFNNNGGQNKRQASTGGIEKNGKRQKLSGETPIRITDDCRGPQNAIIFSRAFSRLQWKKFNVSNEFVLKLFYKKGNRIIGAHILKHFFWYKLIGPNEEEPDEACIWAERQNPPKYSQCLVKLIFWQQIGMANIANNEYRQMEGKQTEIAREFNEKERQKPKKNVYLLIDPSYLQGVSNYGLTKENVTFESFLSSIFYIGKGDAYRCFDHFLHIVYQKHEQLAINPEKYKKISQVWQSGHGVYVMKPFDNLPDNEALIYESAMIQAGLENATNIEEGDYELEFACEVGAILLWKSYQQFKYGQHRPIKRSDIESFRGDRQIEFYLMRKLMQNAD